MSLHFIIADKDHDVMFPTLQTTFLIKAHPAITDVIRPKRRTKEE